METFKTKQIKPWIKQSPYKKFETDRETFDKLLSIFDHHPEWKSRKDAIRAVEFRKRGPMIKMYIQIVSTRFLNSKCPTIEEKNLAMNHPDSPHSPYFHVSWKKCYPVKSRQNTVDKYCCKISNLLYETRFDVKCLHLKERIKERENVSYYFISKSCRSIANFTK